MPKTKAEKILSLRKKNDLLADEVKEKTLQLKEYIELFKATARGKLSNKEIAAVIEKVDAMETDDASSQSDSDTDLEL